MYCSIKILVYIGLCLYWTILYIYTEWPYLVLSVCPICTCRMPFVLYVDSHNLMENETRAWQTVNEIHVIAITSGKEQSLTNGT